MLRIIDDRRPHWNSGKLSYYLHDCVHASTNEPLFIISIKKTILAQSANQKKHQANRMCIATAGLDVDRMRRELLSYRKGRVMDEDCGKTSSINSSSSPSPSKSSRGGRSTNAPSRTQMQEATQQHSSTTHHGTPIPMTKKHDMPVLSTYEEV